MLRELVDAACGEAMPEGWAPFPVPFCSASEFADADDGSRASDCLVSGVLERASRARLAPEPAAGRVWSAPPLALRGRCLVASGDVRASC
mmetsp:Transcript_32821/g.90644  ORF Transcript_32821/g.90644 Transcript_32821/m.90644 type:complete len:90 (+) Transcript_32821:571-840(+)